MPCGECAEEFQTLLKKFPSQVSFCWIPRVIPSQFPSTSSRRWAAFWFESSSSLIFFNNHSDLRSFHNKVNKQLKKAEFDYAYLDDEYDCGRGDTR